VYKEYCYVVDTALTIIMKIIHKSTRLVSRNMEQIKTLSEVKLYGYKQYNTVSTKLHYFNKPNVIYTGQN
jgi:hypothetical protein